MKEIRQITKLEINEALANTSWDLGNKVLYDLCSTYPFHKTDQEIIAKIWLIGRSYAAAIERRKNKDLDAAGDLFYEDKVTPAIKRSGIDDWFALQTRKRMTPSTRRHTWKICREKTAWHRILTRRWMTSKIT